MFMQGICMHQQLVDNNCLKLSLLSIITILRMIDGIQHSTKKLGIMTSNMLLLVQTEMANQKILMK